MLAAFVLAVVCSAAEPVAISGRAMGTTWSVKFVRSLPGPTPTFVERSVAERLEQLEQLFSTYRPQSAISRFNASQSTEWIPVAPEMVRVAEESRRISELTDGAFDVTVNPLVQLWGFGATRRSGSVPNQDAIGAARALVDWRRLETRASPAALRKSEPRLSVDFASMAKGFAVDAISDLLREAGAASHLVQIGGDVKARGSSSQGRGWRVAIEQPSADAATPARVVVLVDQALSTSGDYRNFFVSGDRRYGHIVDPRRGEPVSGPLAAVSVVHPSCATSSAWATALFVLGEEAGYRLAASRQFAALFFVREGATVSARSTPQFARAQD